MAGMLIGALVYLSAPNTALAQGPWDGMSKTTLAAETDPLGAMAFVQRFFGSTPDHDSCDANICLCDAGDSNASAAWQTVRAPRRRRRSVAREGRGARGSKYLRESRDTGDLGRRDARRAYPILHPGPRRSRATSFCSSL